MFTTIIPAEQLYQHINDPGWIIVDCRYDLGDPAAGYRQYLESHIPKAVYADLDKDLSDTSRQGRGRHPLPDIEDLQRVFIRLGIGRDSQVAVYDGSYGSIAARLWWLLKYMSHEKVAVVDGGWQAWLAQGYEVETGARSNPSGSFTGVAREELVVSRERLSSCPLLVDSREPARYRGEIEPIDPVAGHIPGAVNRFWKENLEDNGYFRPPDRISEDFTRLFHNVPSSEAVFYCGSGVTACHNILAAEYSGLPVSRLYPGSWSEWCSVEGASIQTRN